MLVSKLATGTLRLAQELSPGPDAGRQELPVLQALPHGRAQGEEVQAREGNLRERGERVSEFVQVCSENEMATQRDYALWCASLPGRVPAALFVCRVP